MLEPGGSKNSGVKDVPLGVVDDEQVRMLYVPLLACTACWYLQALLLPVKRANCATAGHRLVSLRFQRLLMDARVL